MKFRNVGSLLFFALLILIGTPKIGFAQKMTRISGVVVDANSKEPLPFVSVVFVGKNIGTITDYNGQFELESQWASNKIETAYLGYENGIKNVEVGKNQEIDFELIGKQYNLEEVQIVAKRKRYRNKNNPAVDLIRNVIAHKDSNRIEKYQFYEFHKYEKVEFDINNITEEFRQKKAFKKFQFVFNYVDTSQINGKPFLPIFLKETLSKVYYRKSPKSEKEYVSGTKMVGFHDYIDSDGTAYLLDNIYQNIDIYDNNIDLLTNQFVSPISSIAPTIYKFHILDTLVVNEDSCFQLAFQPRNKADFTFMGNLYITTDGKFSLVKVDMKVGDGINLNFVQDLNIVQEFGRINENCFVRTKDELVIDFNLGEKGIGMYGKRTVITDNYLLNVEQENDLYSGVENTVKQIDHMEKDTAFWKHNRLTQLSDQEENIYSMVDSVQNIPAFKNTMDVIMLLVAGYWNFGNLDVGPVNTFYSFNDVEGFRLRMGGKTSNKFSTKFRMDAYLLYGFNDEKFKYSGSALWSLNNRKLTEKPRHTLKIMYQQETNFPGMEMSFINEDNFLLSFKRGVADKIVYYNMFKAEHVKDWKNGFSTIVDFRTLSQKPGGELKFNYANDDYLSHINTTEVTATFRFAPNEIFYQGIDYKTPVLTKYPIIQISIDQGINGLLDGEYEFSKLRFNLFKRFYLSPIGYTNCELEAGKVFGQVPYLLMFVHRANQTYSYQLRSYNLMNFLEFVSDEYVSFYVEHHFNGFIFNKLPLIKHLKFREIISFKAIYGRVTDKNNPELSPGLMQFPIDENGNSTTFTLQGEPYVEASVGIGNIFKFFRIDLVKRLTYLDNPNVSDLGLRARFKFEF